MLRKNFQEIERCTSLQIVIMFYHDGTSGLHSRYHNITLGSKVTQSEQKRSEAVMRCAIDKSSFLQKSIHRRLIIRIRLKVFRKTFPRFNNHYEGSFTVLISIFYVRPSFHQLFQRTILYVPSHCYQIGLTVKLLFYIKTFIQEQCRDVNFSISYRLQ